MKVQYCKNEHLFTNQHGMEFCPTCGQRLIEGVLPSDIVASGTGKEDPFEDAKEPVGVLLAAAMATPQGQRLVRKVLEKLDDKFFK